MFKKKLPFEQTKKTKLELLGITKRQSEDVKHIKEWLTKKPYINPRTDDLYLFNILAGCKFSLEKTKKKLEYFYTAKHLSPEWFKNRNLLSTEIQNVLNSGIYLLTESGDAHLVLVRWSHSDSKLTPFMTVLKVSLMITDHILMHSTTIGTLGCYVVIDMENVPLSIVQQVSIVATKKILSIFVNGYGTKIKGMYFINCIPVIHTFYGCLKPFLAEKIVSRTKFYEKSNLSNLYKEVPASNLPYEYGGQAGMAADIVDNLRKSMQNSSDWFLKDEEFAINDTAKAITSHDYGIVFGMEGSFRKLELD